MEAIINCSHLSKKCGDFYLKDINFSLEPGYILGVIGVNGAGKTTLLRSILGSYRLDEESGGSVTVAGKNLAADVAAYKEQMGFIIQDTPFDIWMTAMEAGRIYGRYYKKFDLERYAALLREYRVPFEGRDKRRVIKNMSKGQQIRQQMAFAQAYDAKLFIFDEATGNLDVNFRRNLYEKIRELVSTGERSVIYATHLVEEMEELADYLLWLHKKENTGTIRYFGTIDDLKNRYRMVEADADMLDRIEGVFKVGGRSTKTHKEALIFMEGYEMPDTVWEASRYAELKEIMYYVEKQGE